VALLRRARDEGRLDEAEMLMRIHAVRNAADRTDIVRYTADLQRRPEREAPVSAEGRSWDASLFGDVERHGPWRSDHVAISLFGDLELELDADAVTTPEVSVVAVSPFGDVDVTVPEGVEVDVGGFTVFGSKRITVRRAAGDRQPAFALRLKAYTLFGSIRVRSR